MQLTCMLKTQSRVSSTFIRTLTSTRFMEKICVKKLSENAILPVRGSQHSAGYDLSSAEETVIPAKGKGLVKTDLAISIPMNTYARIAPRSGLALKKFIDTGAGVVDYDYRGNVGVVLFNHSDEDFPVARGDRIAQLILERIAIADIEEVDELPMTERGAGGFGSTGVMSCGNADTVRNAKRPLIDEAQRCMTADLLSFISELSTKLDPLKVRQLKELALNNDTGLDAARQVFIQNNNDQDLLQTLDILLTTRGLQP